MQIFLKSTLLFLALGVSGACLAQQPQSAGQSSTPMAVTHHQANPRREAKKLSKQLGLSADQTAQVEPIFAERQQRVQTLMNDSTLDAKGMKRQRRAIMQDTEQKLNAVLTPAQQQQYAAMRAQRRHGQGAPAAATPTV